MKFINLIELDKLYHKYKVQGDCYLTVTNFIIPIARYGNYEIHATNLNNALANQEPNLPRSEKKTNPIRVCPFLVRFVQPSRWHVSPYYQHLLILCRPNLLALLCRKIPTLWLFPLSTGRT